MDDWRNFLLRAIGAPESTLNLQALQLWQQSEGHNFGCNNYLNASDKIAGWSPQAGSDFIPCYPSLGAMIRLYAIKLRSGIYRGIYDALHRSRSLADIWQAIHASPWNSGGVQAATYPVALYAVAFQNVAPPVSSPLGTEGIIAEPARTPPPAGALPSDHPGPKFDDLYRAWDRLTHALGVDWPYEYRRIQRARTRVYAAARIPPPADTSDVPGEYLHPP